MCVCLSVCLHGQNSLLRLLASVSDSAYQEIKWSLMQLNVVNRIWYSLVRWCPGARVLCAHIIGRPEWAEAGAAYACARYGASIASYCFMGAGASCPIYAGLLLQVKGAVIAWCRVTKRTKLSCACYTGVHSEENSKKILRLNCPTMSDDGSSNTPRKAVAPRSGSGSRHVKSTPEVHRDDEEPPSTSGKSHTAIHVGAYRTAQRAVGRCVQRRVAFVKRLSRGGYRPERQRAVGPP